MRVGRGDQCPLGGATGCQAGTAARFSVADRRCTWLPSASITMTGRSLPPIARRSRTNEIFVPSGDQAVPKSSAVAHGQAAPDPHPVSCWGFAPLASMTQIWPPLDDWALKAIFEPSGLQSGTWSLGSAPDVTACGFVPSAFMTQTCWLTG